MSDQPDNETISDGLSTYSVDNDDQLQPADTLIPGEDPVEVGYETADKLHGSIAFGTTADEEAEDETIEQRIRQEVPEDGTAYGAPDNESGLDPEPMAGGDDPDAIPADEDFVGDPSTQLDDTAAPLGVAEAPNDVEPLDVVESVEVTPSLDTDGEIDGRQQA